ncbi:Glutamate 5-kinase [Picochlorum sp. SENEW3]|nr:Glutamate 5-kinase [Picochlorum sp. SENEW3]
MSGFRRVQSHHELNDPNHVPTVVIKVGTSSLIRPEQNSLNLSSLAGIVGLVRDLRNEGYRVVLVSSGAVGVGCQRLELEVRPRLLAKKQALAAVGQVHLMRYYDDLFSAYNITCSQVLLTLENLSSRTTYYNAMNTFNELLNYEVIPIVNENDTVAVEQLRIGDNDTLSAQVATLVHADWLFLLTDVDALYTANPNVDPSARPIHLVPDLWDLEVNTSTAGTQWGTGGMATKLTAARMATAGGCNVAICHFEDPGNVLDILRGKQVGTVFRALNAPVRGRKRWILSMKSIGELWLDAGAVRAVKDRHCSLFSAGIIKVVGHFSDQDVVAICDEEGREFARGLVNYNHVQVDAVKGVSSKQRLKEFGDTYAEDEIVHRSTICLLMPQKKKVTIINDAGEEEETECDDDDDESIVDPLADSRSTTPALPPAIQFVPASALQGLSDNATDDVSNKLNALKSDKNESGKEWKNELVSIVEEDSDKTGDALAKSIEKINLETNDK